MEGLESKRVTQLSYVTRVAVNVLRFYGTSATAWEE